MRKDDKTATKLVKVLVTPRREAEKATQVDHGGTELVWIPNRMIKKREENPDQTETWWIPKWLAENEGIDYDE